MRHFTPEEANEALAAVRPLVERLAALRRDSLALEARLDAVRTRVLGNGGGLDPARVEELQEQATAAAGAARELIQEIEGLGIQVKDPDSGLLDFPAVHPDGSEVLLCWRLGEQAVEFWHTPEGGFRGRKPLPFDRT